MSGRERSIDAPFADFSTEDGPQRRHFAQLAGAGLDARAISLVDWQLKKRIAQFAYVLAGLKAMRAPNPMISVTANHQTVQGELVLIGNGRFYGGSLPMFPAAKLDDGLLDICIFPRVSWGLLMRYAIGFVTGRPIPPGDLRVLRVANATLSATAPVPFELEGDLCGELPVRLGVAHRELRVIA